MLEKQKADKAAKLILKKTWDGSLPVHPEKLAAKIRVNVNRDGQVEKHHIHVGSESDWDLEGASGYAELRDEESGKRSFWCVYNSDESLERQRFTLAHELGHVLLGHVTPGNREMRDTTFKAYGKLKEIAANEFAACLLMPEESVLEKGEAKLTIDQLAVLFKVSPTAMRYRMQRLGMI